MIDFDSKTNEFAVGSTKFLTRLSDAIQMPGYTFEAINFLETITEVADGGIYNLPPNTPTRVVKITGEVLCMEKPVEGEAVFLCLRGKDKSVEIMRMSEFSGSDPVTYSKGDVVVWVGGKNGAKVLNYSTPPFGEGENLEKEVKVDSRSLPRKFWNKYHELIA